MASRVIDTPWKVWIETRRLLLLPVARAYFAACGVRWGDGWRVYGLPVIQRHRGSRIVIGPRLQMRNWLTSNPLGVQHPGMLTTWRSDAVIEIGESFGMSGGTIVAQDAIRIGDRVRLGANCTVIDTDFHPLSVERRAITPTAGSAREIVIGDDVFVGMNAIILKGSRIGVGAVIGAGSVVSGEVAAGQIVAGNPAHPIRGGGGM